MKVLEPNREKMLTVSEVANTLGVTEGYIRRLLRNGVMRGQKLGRIAWLIPESELEKFRDPPRIGRPRSRLTT